MFLALLSVFHWSVEMQEESKKRTGTIARLLDEDDAEFVNRAMPDLYQLLQGVMVCVMVSVMVCV